MDVTSVLARLWRRFRALAGWAQLSLALAAAVILVSPFTSEAEQTVKAGGETATTAGPATTGEAIREVSTTVPATTTPAPPTTSAVPAGVPAGGEDSSVVRVVDGDTLVVSGGTRIRLIGVDTPETVDPSSPVQCFGPESSRYLNELLPVGTRIRLVYDVERLDRYGRTLAYVYKLTDGLFVNLAVARNGFAAQLTVPPNVVHAEELRAAVAQARVANLGLWRSCPSTTIPTGAVTAPTPATTQVTVARATTTTTPAASGCHPSYAGACVPTGFSDVDCAGGTGNGPGYVSTKNFRVVGPDVYGLDGNGDGIACESR
jgi:micrococcal nuclease